ncbi:hypothetical protein HU200_050775 [Digitaria exilis]|uniref:Uncharacterized protein n=1 Tax=Digitaria exilis TaxID=1010633 RepID=A0A835E8P5_9POAL|nr:hypothetical protein HU200_050775 [Digitaria exilis]
MQQVASDLQALKRLYGLLHNGGAPDENLDETSRALMMKMLDDATQQALLKQAKMLSAGSLMSPVLERKLSIQSNRRTRDAAEPPRSLRPLASPIPNLLAGERSSQLSLQYSTVSSRAGSNVHGHRHARKEPVLSRLGSYRSSTCALPPPQQRPSGEQRRSNLSVHRMSVAATSQHGAVTGSNRHADRRERTRHSSSRGDQSPSVEGSNSCRSVSREMSLGTTDQNEEPLLSRLDSYRSSTSALSPQQRRSGLSVNRTSVAATSRHGTVTGSSRHADRRDTTRRHSSSRGDHSPSSLEGSSSSGRRRRSVSSLEMSSRGRRARLQCDVGTPRHVAAAASYSSSTRRPGRLDSRLSLSKTMSRRGSERRPGRGVATPERSSSSNTAVTIHSRIRPERNIKEKHCQRQAEQEEAEVSTRRRGRRKDASVSSGGRSSISRPPRRRALKRIDSGSMYMSSSSRSSPRAPMSHPSTSPTVLPADSSASASSYSPSPPAMSRRRGIDAWTPVFALAPRMSRSMRQRRRQEVLEQRVGRLRRLKSKIAAVFHHRHDHHHHHHFGRGGQEQEGPSSSRGIGGIPGEQNRMSPWRYIEGMFDRRKGKGKKTTTSRTAVGTPAAKRRGGGGGGGNVHALFDAMWQHLRSKRKAPAATSVKKMRKMATRSKNKMHWWQQLGRRRRGKTQVAAGRPRRRLI